MKYELSLNAYQAFQISAKKIDNLCNIDKHVQPFTYPLFDPKGTFFYSVDLQLPTTKINHQHQNLFGLAKYLLQKQSIKYW